MAPPISAANPKRDPYARVPHHLARDTRLSLRARLLAVILLGYAGDKDKCWPKRSTLAKALGGTPSKVDRAIDELQKKRGLVVERHRECNHYIVDALRRPPEEVQPPAAPPNEDFTSKGSESSSVMTLDSPFMSSRVGTYGEYMRREDEQEDDQSKSDRFASGTGSGGEGHAQPPAAPPSPVEQQQLPLELPHAITAALSSGDTQAAAQAWVDLRFEVVPLHGTDDKGRCTCGFGGDTFTGRGAHRKFKHPRLTGGHHQRLVSPAEVDRAWATFRSPANVGIRMGLDRIGLDVDVRNGGLGTWAFLLQCYPSLKAALSTAWIHRTPTGGFHYIFTTSFAVQNGIIHLACGAHALGPGVDVIHRSGYLVAPPSRTPNGLYIIEQHPHAEPGPLPLSIEQRLKNQFEMNRAHRDDGRSMGADSTAYGQLCNAIIARNPFGIVMTDKRDESLNGAVIVHCPDMIHGRPDRNPSGRLGTAAHGYYCVACDARFGLLGLGVACGYADDDAAVARKLRAEGFTVPTPSRKDNPVNVNVGTIEDLDRLIGASEDDYEEGAA